LLQGGLEAAGNCRACVVEVEGERTLAASCCRQAAAGMVVQTNSNKAIAAQKMVLELLLADMPRQVNPNKLKADNELTHWCQQMGIQSTRFEARASVSADLSHPDCSEHGPMHPVHPLRTRLPRGAGERCHWPGFSR